MNQSPRDLRLDVPEVEPPDDLVHRLAALARASTPSRAGRSRFMALLAAALSTVFLSVGTAWATGALTVPGIPAPPGQPAEPGRISPSTPSASDPAATLDPTPRATPSGVGSAPGTPGTRPGAGPTRPAHPTKPTKPVHPTKPTKPAQPTKPNTPAQPTKPTKPTKPARPAPPTHPAQPAAPGKGNDRAKGIGTLDSTLGNERRGVHG